MVDRSRCPRGQFRVAPSLASPNRRFFAAVTQLLVIGGWFLIDAGSLLAQTWTQITPPAPVSNMILLTNGTILVQGAGVSANWYLLSPDNNGNYSPGPSAFNSKAPTSAGGTWTVRNPMSTARENFSSWVIPNGNVVVSGGEYESDTSGGDPYFNLSDIEVYNPSTGQWTQSKNSYPGFSLDFDGGPIGNTPTMLLPTGQILFGDLGSSSTYLYNPPPVDTWSNSFGLTPVTNYAQTSGPGISNYTSVAQSYVMMPNTVGGIFSWPVESNQNPTPVAAWKPNTFYQLGDAVTNAGYYYVCIGGYSADPGAPYFGQYQPGGISNKFAGPTTQGINIRDGNLNELVNNNPANFQDYVVWSYLTPWVPNTPYQLNQGVYYGGLAYFCTKAGTSAPGNAGPQGDTGVLWSNNTALFKPTLGQIYSNGLVSWQLTQPANFALNSFAYSEATYPNQPLLGPASMMPDGSVIQFGSNGSTGIYNFGATAQWIQGPTFPAGTAPDGAPGAMMPNGLFLIAADTAPGQKSPTVLYTYNYQSQSLTKLSPPAAVSSDLATAGASSRRMLVVPNGHVLISTGTNIWDYSPAGAAPLATWSPTVNPAGVTATNPSSSTTPYLLKGTRLTGISAGATYGANASSATNYPIVALTSTTGGSVTATSVTKYATTSGWTPQISSPGDSTPQTVQFTLPAGFGVGTYALNTVANGISSNSYQLTVAPPPTTYVNVIYSPQTEVITLTGDQYGDNVSLTLKNNILTIAGSGTTLIQAPQPATWTSGQTKIILAAPNSLITVGMSVANAAGAPVSIPASTTVTAVSGTSVTLSHPTTAAGTNQTLEFTAPYASASSPSAISVHFATNINLQTSLTITGTFTNLNNYIVMNAVSAKTVTFTFGVGANTVTASYCNLGSLALKLSTLSSNTGDLFGQAASKIGSLTLQPPFKSVTQ